VLQHPADSARESGRRRGAAAIDIYIDRFRLLQMGSLTDLDLSNPPMAFGSSTKLQRYCRDPALGVAVAHFTALVAAYQLETEQRRQADLNRLRSLAGDAYRQLHYVTPDHVIPIHRAHHLRGGVLLDQGEGEEKADHQSFTA